MFRIHRSIIVLSGLAILAACSGKTNSLTQVDPGASFRPMMAAAEIPATEPASPALPSGHPDISSMLNQPAAPSGSLPAGHPDISQRPNSPNSTGAADSAMPAGVNLPAGHPDLSKMKAPTSQPIISGSVLIQAVQGTPNGPAVGADEFSLELYVQGQLLDKVDGKLDPRGTAVVNGVPLLAKPTSIVKVKHAGVEYQASGEAIDNDNPNQQLQVAVYETTDKAPDWHIRMRHVMVSHADGVLNVMEMLAIDNPTDRAWTGNPAADGKRVTFTLPLPDGAKEIQLIDGFREPFTRIEGNKLVNAMALNPGSTQYQIRYQLPVTDGKAAISIASPATAQTLMVFLPDDGSIVKAQGVELAGTTDMGTGKTRFYRATEVAAGQIATLAISGIVEETRKAADTSVGSQYAAQIVAGSGAAVIMVFGVAFLFIKGSPRKA